MAIGRRVLASGSSTTDGTSFSTASIAPAAETLLLVFATTSATGSLTSPAIALSGLSLSWTKHADTLYGDIIRRVACWTAVVGSSPGSGALTFTTSAAGGGSSTSSDCGWVVYEITGANHTTPVPQAVTGGPASDATSASITLAAASNPNNRPFAFFCHRIDQGKTPRANWTEDADFNGTGPFAGWQAQSRHDAFETTASATWASSARWGGIAVEIAAAPVAIANRVLTSAFNTTDGSSYTTASITPQPNALLVLFCNGSIASGTTPQESVSGLGLTWTRQTEILYSSSPGVRRVSCWTANSGPSPGSGAITIAMVDAGSGTTASGMAHAVLEFTGVNLTTPIRQAVAAEDDANNLSITMSGSGNAANRPASWFCHRVAQAKTPRTNWTELVDFTGSNPSAGCEAQWRSGAWDNTASATWATADDCAGIALELVAQQPVVGTWGVRV